MRLLLRLSTLCNNGCLHCPLADLRSRQREGELPSALAEQAAVRAIERGANEGCRELVILRGEVTLLPWLGRLVRFARHSGYSLVQLQTNGRRLADGRYAAHLHACGVTHAEISLYGSNSTTHDAVARVPGAFAQTQEGIRQVRLRNWDVLLNVHVVAANAHELSDIVHRAARWNVRRVQLNLMRAVPEEQGGSPSSSASPRSLRGHMDEASARAHQLGIQLTTEAVPNCAFETVSARPVDAWQTVPESIRIEDLDRVVHDLAHLRSAYRSHAQACETCGHAEFCPRTWQSLVDTHGPESLLGFPSFDSSKR